MRQRLARLVPLLAVALAACGGEGAPELPVAGRIPLATDAAETVFVGAGERIWLGAGGSLQRVQEGGGTARFAVGGSGSPRVVGEAGRILYVRAGERLLALDAESGRPLAEREVADGPVLLDVRGRFVLAAAASGAVRGLDPSSLEPLWIWPSLGASPAVALSPEGDRAYTAVARGADAAALIARDLQTGRELHGEVLSVPVAALRTGPGGDLVALVGTEGEQAVLALRPEEGGFRPRWRRRARTLGLTGPLELRVHPGSGRVALFSPGNDDGLRLLEAETGDLLGSVDAAVRDAAFGAGGSLLYLLTGSEVRIVRARR